MRHADEFPVGKHRARTLTPVVEHHIDAAVHQVGMQPVSSGFHVGGTVVANRTNHHGKRRNRRRPDDAARIEVLFNGSAQDACDANAVATHLHELRLAGFIQVGGLHLLAVIRAEQEHVAHLDAALDCQHAGAIRCRVASDDIANVRHDIRLGHVTTPVHTGEVKIRLVGAADEIAHGGNGAVGHDPNRLPEADQAEIARPAAEVLVDLGGGRESKTTVQTGNFAGLDVVQCMVAAHQQQPDGHLRDVTGLVFFFGGQHQRLDR